MAEGEGEQRPNMSGSPLIPAVNVFMPKKIKRKKTQALFSIRVFYALRLISVFIFMDPINLLNNAQKILHSVEGDVDVDGDGDF